MDQPELEVLDARFAIHRLPADDPLPPAVIDATLCWIARTDAGLSIVCDAALGALGGRASTDWAALRALGPLSLSATGILAAITTVLAAARVPVFALSTHDTDYVRMPARDLGGARRVPHPQWRWWSRWRGKRGCFLRVSLNGSSPGFPGTASPSLARRADG